MNRQRVMNLRNTKTNLKGAHGREEREAEEKRKDGEDRIKIRGRREDGKSREREREGTKKYEDERTEIEIKKGGKRKTLKKKENKDNFKET